MLAVNFIVHCSAIERSYFKASKDQRSMIPSEWVLNKSHKIQWISCDSTQPRSTPKREWMVIGPENFHGVLTRYQNLKVFFLGENFWWNSWMDPIIELWFSIFPIKIANHLCDLMVIPKKWDQLWIGSIHEFTKRFLDCQLPAADF